MQKQQGKLHQKEARSCHDTGASTQLLKRLRHKDRKSTPLQSHHQARWQLSFILSPPHNPHFQKEGWVYISVAYSTVCYCGMRREDLNSILSAKGREKKRKKFLL